MKRFKRITVLLTTAVALVSAFAFAACSEEVKQNTEQGETPPAEKVTYTATVLDPLGSPVKDLQVKWGNGTSFRTLENGTAKADLPAGEYDISVEGFLPIYKYTAVKTTKDDHDKTIRLEWNPEDGKVVYTVKVVYPNGDPVEGVKLGLCVNGGNCTNLPAATNAQGEAYSIGVINAQKELYLWGLTPQEYEVQVISGVPAGYEVEVNAENHYANDKATADKHTVTVTLKEV